MSKSKRKNTVPGKRLFDAISDLRHRGAYWTERAKNLKKLARRK